MNHNDFANYSTETINNALKALETLPIKYGPINNLYNALMKLKRERIVAFINKMYQVEK